MKLRFIVRSMIILSIMVCTLCFSTGMSSVNASNSESIADIKEKPVIQAFLQESMIIDSNEDFIDLGCTGNGSLINPYIIDGFRIAGGVSLNWGMYITNVTKHFVIQDCIIETSNCIVLSNLNEASVKILNSETVVLDFFNPAIILTSISIQTCSNVIIDNCNFDSKIRGIDISNSNNISITNCNFASSYNTEIQESKYCGIYSIGSLDCGFINNTFEEGGFYFDTTLEDYFTFEIQNNILGILPISFFENQTGLIIDAPLYGQLYLFNCSDSIIRNQVVSSTFLGIGCYYSSGIILSENECSENQYGLISFKSNQTIIKNNLCSYNIIGIGVKYGIENIIEDNVCCNNLFNSGIEVTCNSIDTQLTSNNCSFNTWGYGIYESSTNSSFIDNVCNYNFNGIRLRSSVTPNLLNNTLNYNKYNGLWLDSSQDFTVMNNIITYNSLNGIAVTSSSLGSIAYNLILENFEYGLILDFKTSDVRIHHNSFINNHPTSTKGQAKDDGSKNYWYNPDTFVGNYWTDLGRRNKYPIDGNANSYDLYPLKKPIVLPDESYPLKTSFVSLILLFPALLLVASIKNSISRYRRILIEY